MASQASAIYRMRPGGNAANGAGFDPPIGTPRLSLSDLACAAGSATVTSATGGFTTGMVNGYLTISAGSGFIAGAYRIVTYNSSNSIVLESSPVPLAIAGTSGTGAVSAGTSYHCQDAPQLTLTDLACANNNTLTSVTGGFTALMVGSAIRISTLPYWIMAFSDTNTVTLDRTPGTLSAASGKVGGAAALPANLSAIVVPGNIVYIFGVLGNASSYPTTTDYTTTGFITPTAGTFGAGRIRWTADPSGPMPTLQSDGLFFYVANYNSFYGLYFSCSSNSNPSLGILNGTGMDVRGCVLNCRDRAGMVGINCAGSAVVGNEIYGGSTTPSALSSGATGLVLSAYSSHAIGNRIHHFRDSGISDNGYVTAVFNEIYGCQGDQIKLTAAAASGFTGIVAWNTLDAGAGHGINVSGTAVVSGYSILNNSITNHTGSGKAGITVGDGTATLNDLRKLFIDYNNIYNNTSNYSGVSPGLHDISVNPNYVNSAAGDFTPGNAALKAAFPSSFRGITPPSYPWIGAVQPAGASGGLIFPRGFDGGFPG